MWKQIVVAILLGSVVAIVGGGLVIRALTPASAPVNAQTQLNNNQFRGGGQGRGNGQGVAAQAVPMTTLQGAVVSVDEFALTVRAANGEQVVVQNRPWSFALEQKFSAKVGEQIKLTGFYQNGLFEVAQMENVTSGARAEIRDQSGRPGWAGKGNRFNTGTVN